MMPPSACSCCECQGKRCLMPHPGHSHRRGIGEREDWIHRMLDLHKRKEEPHDVSHKGKEP